jgi:hypothetical protein
LLLGEDASFQELNHKTIHFSVGDATTHTLHERMMIDVVKTALDVSLDNPLVRRISP